MMKGLVPLCKNSTNSGRHVDQGPVGQVRTAKLTNTILFETENDETRFPNNGNRIKRTSRNCLRRVAVFEVQRHCNRRS